MATVDLVFFWKIEAVCFESSVQKRKFIVSLRLYTLEAATRDFDERADFNFV